MSIERVSLQDAFDLNNSGLSAIIFSLLSCEICKDALNDLAEIDDSILTDRQFGFCVLTAKTFNQAIDAGLIARVPALIVSARADGDRDLAEALAGSPALRLALDNRAPTDERPSPTPS